MFVVLACVLCWLMMYRTKLGYEIRTIGQNRHFAKYAGIGAVSYTHLDVYKRQGPNVAGVIGSAVAAGILINMLG